MKIANRIFVHQSANQPRNDENLTSLHAKLNHLHHQDENNLQQIPIGQLTQHKPTSKKVYSQQCISPQKILSFPNDLHWSNKLTVHYHEKQYVATFVDAVYYNVMGGPHPSK